MKPSATRPGTLLLAVPQMLDPNFMHSVVLLCEHGANGAYGLVVNRPAEITVGSLLPEHPLLGASEFPVYAGGPVGLDTLQYVHAAPDRIPGGTELAPGVWIGGELDALARWITGDERDARSRARLFLGYSGWGEGQLDGELAIGSWVRAPADATVVFGSLSPEETWRAVLRGLGDDGQRMAQEPPDPSWN